MASDLKDKIAVVTGAASGIGLATTKALLDQGAKVVLVDRNQEALVTLTAELGERAFGQVTDLLDPQSCDAMIPQILDKLGQIDILHCNADSYISGDLTETTPGPSTACSISTSTR